MKTFSFLTVCMISILLTSYLREENFFGREKLRSVFNGIIKMIYTYLYFKPKPHTLKHFI